MPRLKGAAPLLLGVTLLFAVSAGLRVARFDPGHNVKNLDASYHVLLTAKALRDTPARVHRFLPLISLGQPQDKYINWGATVPDGQGNYYYTSFPSLGFVVPYAAFAVTGAEPTLRNLLHVNLGVHYLGALLLSLLIWRATRSLADDRTRTVVTLLAAASYLFAYEALYSHGVIYWHHSLFQLVWLVQLLAFERLNSGEAGRGRVAAGVLLATCFLAPLTEWTGYVANAVLVLLLAWRGWRVAEQRRGAWALAAGVCAVTVVAMALFVAHFVSVLGFAPLKHALMTRFQARNTVSFDPSELFMGLLRGYFESYGLLVLLALTVPLVLRMVVGPVRKAWSPAFLALVVAAAFPLLENVLMLQHAVEYTFDRLKALVLMTTLLAGFTGVARGRVRQLAVALWVLAILGNVAMLWLGQREWDIRGAQARSERVIQAIAQADEPCLILANAGGVRGWVNLTLGRGVYEGVEDFDQLAGLMAHKKACAAILLMGGDAGNQIYEWNAAYLLRAGATEARDLLSGEVLPLPSLAPEDTPFALTDGNWLNGVARQGAGFFVRGTSSNVWAYAVGRTLEFADGSVRKIVRSDLSGSYLNVWVEGAPLNGEVVGNPRKLVVRPEPTDGRALRP